MNVIAGWSSPVARQAHNLKAVGSNPTPATNFSVSTSANLKNLKANFDTVAQLAGILEELGQRIREVGQLLNPHAVAPAMPDQGMMLVDLINEMLEAKAAAEVRDRYLTQLHHSMVLFWRDNGNRPIQNFSPVEIEHWSQKRDWKPATRRSYLTDVRTLFNFAVKRDYLKRSPAAAVDLPNLEDKTPGVHSPAEVKKILHTAQRMDLGVMRILAVQYFAGARPLSEAAKLEERHLHPRLVEIEGPRCKTRRRRLVMIQPALKAFLKLGGTLPVVNLKRRWLAVREAAGVKWSQDVTRHSFCTYHLAAFGDAKKTALEAGHSENELFGKYRALRTPAGELITKELAEEFWAIRPA